MTKLVSILVVLLLLSSCGLESEAEECPHLCTDVTPRLGILTSRSTFSFTVDSSIVVRDSNDLFYGYYRPCVHFLALSLNGVRISIKGFTGDPAIFKLDSVIPERCPGKHSEGIFIGENSDIFRTNDRHVGSVEIKSFDRENLLVSGSFSYAPQLFTVGGWPATFDSVIRISGTFLDMPVHIDR